MSLINKNAGTSSTTDRIKVHDKGDFQDGTAFDSPCKRGVPTTFPLNVTFACWL